MLPTQGKMHAMVVGTQGVMHADVGRVLVINITEHRRHNPSDEMVTKLKLSKPVRTLYPLDGTRLVVSVDYQLLVYTLQQSTLVRQHWLSTSRTVTALHCHEGEQGQCVWWLFSIECSFYHVPNHPPRLCLQMLWLLVITAPSTCIR